MSKKFDKIRKKVNKLVKDACYSPNNAYTYTAWEHHIEPVIAHCLDLGKKLKADLEVLELAALIHDYSAIVDIKNQKDHHIHSARMAREILEKEDFNEIKIQKIEEAIISHRGSLKMDRNSLEAKILASADAMSHFTELADMFYLTYGVHKFKTKEGAEWLLSKLERSWNKIIPEGREMVSDDYSIALKIIKKVTHLDI